MPPKRNIVFIGLILGLTAVLAGSSSAAAQSLAQPTKRYTLVTLLISPSQASLKPGETTELAARGMGTDSQNHTVTTKIRWTSSAPSVATVSGTGVVTAIAPGTAVITGRRGIQSSSIITVNNPPGGAVPATLFSMTTHSRMDWPSVTTSAIRLWDTNTYWGDMNPAADVYDFTTFDKWLSTAQANGADVIYTFGQIPNWASSSPSMVCGSNANVPLGSCAPPDDLNNDGTGTNKHWKDFVTAVVTHANGQIKYWEIWNEPTVPDYWQGNNSQLLRMAQDAYGIIKSIQPSALVTTPTPSTGIKGVANWMGPYLALGGGQYADIMTFHGYSWKDTPGLWPVPEDIVPLVENLKAVLVAYGQDQKPLWCTEGSWGNTSGNGFSDPDLHAAFVARHYLLQESEGVLRYYWYAWDNQDGLWDHNTGRINDSGTAYQEVQNWIVGATPSDQCTAVGTLWTCSYTRSGGFQAQAMWDTSQSCSNGSCTTLSIPVGSQYLSYLDLAGQSHTIKNSSVPVGAKPIFIQNQ